MRAIFLFSLLFVLTACDKEALPELGNNLMETEAGNYFELGGVSFEFYSNNQRNVRLNFSSNFNKLSASQRSQIEHILITQEGSSLVYFDLPPESTFIFDGKKTVGTLCYLFRYQTFEGATTPFEKICIDVI